MPSDQLYAVLTGDLIKSRALTGQKIVRARQELDEAVRLIRKWDGALVAAEPEFFRGDSWQMALSSPGRALRAALLVRALLRWKHGADTRISIGIGGAERIDRKRASLSAGAAFVASGMALDKMPARVSLTIAFAQRDDVTTRALVQLCGVIAGRWTARQAQLIVTAIDPSEPKQDRIGKQFGVSQQAVQRILASANWVAVRDALAAFEHVY